MEDAINFSITINSLQCGCMRINIKVVVVCQWPNHSFHKEDVMVNVMALIYHNGLKEDVVVDAMVHLCSNMVKILFIFKNTLKLNI